MLPSTPRAPQDGLPLLICIWKHVSLTKDLINRPKFEVKVNKNCRNSGDVEQHMTELQIYLCRIEMKDVLLTCLFIYHKK